MNGIERFCGTPHLSKKKITKYGIRNYSSVVIVNRSFHADDETLLYVGMNDMKNITHADPELDMEQMVMRMKDLNQAKNLLERSIDNMYYRIAEHILVLSKEVTNKEDAADLVNHYVDVITVQGAGSISKKKLLKTIEQFYWAKPMDNDRIYPISVIKLCRR